MRKCLHCGAEKHPDEFYDMKGGRDGLRPECMVCTRINQNKWRQKNLDACRARDRQYRKNNPDIKKDQALRFYFGITLKDYNEMLATQGGGCAICGVARTLKRRLAVDHCHTTGKVRGLLCMACNKGLGSFADKPELLLKAIDYLNNTGRDKCHTIK